ncbi:hydrophobic surface binding protein [Mycena sanguinolenta]|nr:hydrophobic surface binding protein [Mycena sanguinolenta]
MVRFTRSFFSLCLIAASFAAPNKRTVAQIEADIAAISTQVTVLDNAIKASNPISSLYRTFMVNEVNWLLNIATIDMKNTGPMNEVDATTILNSMKAIQPVMIDWLTRIATEEPAFAALPIGGIPALVLQDLQNLKADMDGLATALISTVPADLKAEASTIQSELDAAFATAIAAFS